MLQVTHFLYLISHKEISISHVIVSSALLITGRSYFCTVSPGVSPVGHIQDFEAFFQVPGLLGFTAHSFLSGDLQQSCKWESALTLYMPVSHSAAKLGSVFNYVRLSDYEKSLPFVLPSSVSASCDSEAVP